MGPARPAAAFTACDASQVIAQEPNCPNNTSTCLIRSTVVTPSGQNCTFDFGDRDVVIGTGAAGGAGKLQFGSRSVAIKAGSLTVNSNGLLEGLGAAAAPNDVGGMLTIATTRDVFLSGSSGVLTVDLRANATAGVLDINASGNVTITGKVDAGGRANQPLANGGTIRIVTAQNLTIAAPVQVSAGANEAASAGLIDLIATGNVQITALLEFNGPTGGDLTIEAGGTALVSNLTGNALGAAGSGGRVTIVGDHGVTVNGTANLRGASGTDGGGDGGSFCVEALQGAIHLEGSVFAESGAPDGQGGEIEVVGGGDITLGSNVASPLNQISANGNGVESSGGSIAYEAAGDIDIRTSGRNTVSGGEGGGSIDLLAGRSVFIRGRQNLTGREAASAGGIFEVSAGETATGNVEVRAQIDVSAGGCASMICGMGGTVGISGCNVTVFSGGGEVRATAPDGGSIDITARDSLTVDGPITAARTIASGTHGGVQITHSNATTPVIGTGLVSPSPPEITSRPLCSAPGQANCLVPCPACGNGVIEFPEECDSSGTPTNCDGCSALCLIENCNDGFVCTTDTCDPTFGCINTAVPQCTEPTSTPSVTRTRTATRTPTRTGTPSPTRTRTPTPPCAGDCDRDHSVSAADVQRLMSIINLCDGNASGCAAVPGADKQCTAADANGNGVISASELARVLRNLIQFPGSGCQP